jgi:ADP-ribosylglycohydrolase
MTPAFGVGYFGHAAGEWTDDTSMAVPILNRLASGETLEDPRARRDRRRVAGWARTAKDVGVQTRGVLALLSTMLMSTPPAWHPRAHTAARGAAGNGSLMRTGPVALGYLDRPRTSW